MSPEPPPESAEATPGTVAPAPGEGLPAPRWVGPALGAAFLLIAFAFHRMASLDAPSDPVEPFLKLYWTGWFGWLAAAVMVLRVPPRGRRALAGIAAGAVALRFLAWQAPVLLETDYHRYLWDGYVTSQGMNPYEFSPMEVRRFLTSIDRFGGVEHVDEDPSLDLSDEEKRRLAVLAVGLPNPEVRRHLYRANHPEIPTCYPPVAQLGFAFASAVAPGDVRAWKAFVALVDLGICLLVLALLLELGREPAWVLLYAWNPLPIKEYANTAHYDPLATLFTLLAVLVLMRRRRLLAGALLGMGAAAKLYPILLVPALARRLRWGGALACGATLGLFWVPFLGIGPAAFEGLIAFLKDWEFNSSLFGLTFAAMKRLDWIPRAKASFLLEPTGGGRDFYLQVDLEPFFYARALTGVLLLGLVFLVARWEEDADWSIPARAFAVVAGIFFCAPVADPWYLPWFLPYAAVFPSAGILLLTGTVSNYYLYFLNWEYVTYQGWELSRPLEYLPVYLALAWELPRVLRDNPGLLGRGIRAESADGEGRCTPEAPSRPADPPPP